MKRNRKKLSILGFLLGLVLLIVSCAPVAAPGETTGQDDGGQQEAPADTADEDDADDTDDTDEPAEVEIPEVDFTDSEFNEAPELAALVAAGELPPVHERLPLVPFVSSAPEIGTYGGIYRGASFGPTHGQLDTEALRFVGLLRLEPDLRTMRPFLIYDWEVNDDFTVYTLYLREGLRWSDGERLTSGDFRFWFDHVLMNEYLTPVIPTRYISGGEVMQLETPDDYTVIYSFANPNPAFDITMLRSMFPGDVKWDPQHYLQDFHIDFNPDADAVAQEYGFEDWVQHFLHRRDRTQAGTNVTVPCVTPWVLSRIDEQGNRYFDRNPFYFVVDREGNQLPYIDQQIGVLVPDNQNRILRLMNGELHAAAENPLPVRDFTLYVEGEEQGNYTVFLFDNTRATDAAVTFNINHSDLVLREIFNDLRFREAMSLAIDRNVINATLFYGRADARQAVPPPYPNTSFMEDWMFDHMMEFNLEEANRLLDEMGLEMNAAGQRLRPDGEPLFFVLETIEEFAPQGEMVSEMWTENVGVRVELRVQERAFMRERFSTNERDAQMFTLDSVTEFALRANPDGLRPAWRSWEIGFAPLYYEWFATGGEEGLEPPAEIQELRDMVNEWIVMSPEDPAFQELGREIAERHTLSMYYIGTTVAPRVVIISNLLGNTPTEGTFAGDFGFWYPFRGDSWFFR